MILKMFYNKPLITQMKTIPDILRQDVSAVVTLVKRDVPFKIKTKTIFRFNYHIPSLDRFDCRIFDMEYLQSS